MPGSRHEILQETDRDPQRFWAAFDAYLGVDAKAGVAQRDEHRRRPASCRRASPAATMRRRLPAGSPVPGRDAPAGALDDGDQRHDVVGLQAGLDDEVDEAAASRQ